MITARKCVVLILIGFFFLFGCTDSWTRAEKEQAKNTTGGIGTFTIEVENIRRCYLVHVPLSYDCSKKWPVVIMFHGGGGAAKIAMREARWPEKADKEGFLAVFPEGTSSDASRPSSFLDNPQTWNDGSKRSNVGAAMREVPDIKFVSAMLTDLKNHFSVDERRIYTTGFSNGASMTFLVARELSQVIAATAPVAGSDWSHKTNSKRPVPLLYITGSADPLNPTGGGKIHIGQKAFGEKPSIKEMISRWVKMHGCPDKGRVIYNKNGATGIAYSLPGESPKVVLYTIDGHGHHWPGGKSSLPARLAGENTAKLNATDIIWEFFKTHSLSGNMAAKQKQSKQSLHPR
jgi:polyhydroxybutyrate depolymerase